MVALLRLVGVSLVAVVVIMEGVATTVNGHCCSSSSPSFIHRHAFLPALTPRTPAASSHFISHSIAVNMPPPQAPSFVPTTSPAVIQHDKKGRERLVFSKDGYSYWQWLGHRIHYICYESDADMEDKAADHPRSPVVLIHGFGASAFHWRYNIPELSKRHRVYAIDLLGFGLSDKPLIEYDVEMWQDQVACFLREVAGVNPDIPQSRAALVGNSLGGYMALSTSACHPELVKSCAILNGAGMFDSDISTITTTRPSSHPISLAVGAIMQYVIQASVAYYAFNFIRHAVHIKQVLRRAYLNKENVDDDLIESIRYPCDHPNAAEVFYRHVCRASQDSIATINTLLKRLSVPLLLLWGMQDPLISPMTAEKITTLYPHTKNVGLEAGHCPHDEVPERVNEEILRWLDETHI